MVVGYFAKTVHRPLLKIVSLLVISHRVVAVVCFARMGLLRLLPDVRFQIIGLKVAVGSFVTTNPILTSLIALLPIINRFVMAVGFIVKIHLHLLTIVLSLIIRPSQMMVVGSFVNPNLLPILPTVLLLLIER